MKKSATFFLLALLGFLLTSCSGPRPMSQLKIGIWAAERDLWEEAVFRWTRVIQTAPNSAPAHNNLAVAYEKKGMIAEARREYELALQLAPKNTYIKMNFDRFKSAVEPKEGKPLPAKPDKEKQNP